MGNKKGLISILLVVLCTVTCFAKQICFQVVQHDESAIALTEQSLAIEDEVLNMFFEYGFIVTNSDAQISNSSVIDEEIYQNGIGEAFNGYSDYFVQINLFYSRTENTTTVNSDLQKINYSVANAKTGKKLADMNIDNIALGKRKDDLKTLTSNLAAQINKTIKANKA